MPLLFSAWTTCAVSRAKPPAPTITKSPPPRRVTLPPPMMPCPAGHKYFLVVPPAEVAEDMITSHIVPAGDMPYRRVHCTAMPGRSRSGAIGRGGISEHRRDLLIVGDRSIGVPVHRQWACHIIARRRLHCDGNKRFQSRRL